MKSIEQKRMEALARREEDLEFWQRSLRIAVHEHQVDALKRKIKSAERDITNLKRKLSLS